MMADCRDDPAILDISMSRDTVSKWNCFLHNVKPAELSPKIIQCNEWLRRLQTTHIAQSVSALDFNFERAVGVQSSLRVKS